MKEETTNMEDSMEKEVRDIILGAYQYKNEKADRANYISDRLKETFPSINWAVFIYDSGYGHGCLKNCTTSYYYHNIINNSYNIILGWKK